MTKTKKQLRAEAVERLGECEPMGCFNVLREAFGWKLDSRHSDGEWRDALIDLLTDDEPTCKPKQVVDKQAEQASEVAGNAQSYNLGGVSGGEIIGNGESYKQDTREQLEADMREILMGVCEEVYTAHPNGSVFSEYGDPDALEELLESAIGLLDRQAMITERFMASTYEEQAAQLVNGMNQARADLGEAYNRGFDDGLHANTRAAFSAAWQALGDESAIKIQAQRIRELEAEVKEQRKRVREQRERANDAERGVLSEEWYVCRDRYEDDIAELKAERDSLENNLNSAMEMLSETQRTCNELTAERDKLRVKNSRQRKQLSELQYAMEQRNNGEPKKQWKKQVRDLEKRLRDCDKNRIEFKEQRDELREALEATELGQIHGMYLKACEERDRLQDVVRKQAESFKSLEAEGKRERDANNTLRASVAGLKDTVEKQEAEIERLAAENRELNMRVHGTPF